MWGGKKKRKEGTLWSFSILDPSCCLVLLAAFFLLLLYTEGGKEIKFKWCPTLYYYSSFTACVCTHINRRAVKKKKQNTKRNRKQSRKLFFCFLLPPAENIWFIFTDGYVYAQLQSATIHSTHSIIKRKEKGKEDKEL